MMSYKFTGRVLETLAGLGSLIYLPLAHGGSLGTGWRACPQLGRLSTLLCISPILQQASVPRMVTGIQERTQKHKSPFLSSASIRCVLLARTGHMVEASHPEGQARGGLSVWRLRHSPLPARTQRASVLTNFFLK